jgi:hypothetical protein
LLNGSVRTYGHWSGTKSDSGKTFKGLWYHYLTFDENGKIINGGDFGDATGLIMSGNALIKSKLKTTLLHKRVVLTNIIL